MKGFSPLTRLRDGEFPSRLRKSCGIFFSTKLKNAESESERFGFCVENARLAFAINQGQNVSYWHEEPLEIDAVFEGSWGKWAVEVKTRKFNAQSLKGLFEFSRRNPAFTPLVISAAGDEETARRHGLLSISREDFLVSGPPAVG